MFHPTAIVETIGLIVGPTPLCAMAYFAHSKFVETMNDASAEIKALAEEVKGFQLLLG